MKVIQFPIREKSPKQLPRQRIFYLGQVNKGPFSVWDLHDLYLKRKGKINNIRKWSIITYGKHFEWDTREYSLTLDECEEKDLLEMLARWDMDEMVTFDELKEMGWKGKIYKNTKIIPFIYN